MTNFGNCFNKFLEIVFNNFWKLLKQQFLEIVDNNFWKLLNQQFLEIVKATIFGNC